MPTCHAYVYTELATIKTQKLQYLYLHEHRHQL